MGGGREVIFADEPRRVDAGGGSRKERDGSEGSKKKRKSSDNSIVIQENHNLKKKQTPADESDLIGFDKSKKAVIDQTRPSSSSQPNSVPQGVERDAGMVSSSAPVKPTNVLLSQNSMQNQNVRSNVMGPPNSNSARIDLNSMESLPDDTKQVILTSLHETKLITSVNPCKMEISLKELCGDTEKLEYLKSGSIIVPTKSIDQTKKLLNAK